MSHITREQRYTIYSMNKQGYKQKEIAQTIGKDKSVISRELKRNSTSKGKYSFVIAQEISEMRKERFSRKRKFTSEVEKRVKRLLKEEDWSPEQIVGHCQLEGLPMVSIERIYQYIRKDKEEGGTLYKHCRHRLKHRKRPIGKNISIKDRVSIEERPAEANGKRFGDWEMDTIVGPGNKDAILTLVERSTCFTIIRRLPEGKDSNALADIVIDELLPYKNIVRTITTDNGTEFAQHNKIAKKLNTNIYFTHPYSSWEKGLIENTNKLIRQYIKKKDKFDSFTDKQIKNIQEKINRRPRKKLGFLPPFKVFYLCLS